MLDNLSGRSLGQYELGPMLGRGGMAAVYQAYQPSLDRHVAIKVMLSHLAGDPQFIHRFQREAKAVARLQHPHIITVFDFGVDAMTYFMVMEYIRGGTLFDAIGRVRRLPIETALRITLEVTDALAYAHRQGMIHRDIKPTNVMFLDEHGQHSVLTDFGIARLLYDQTTSENKTSGTPAYMSPEVINGHPAQAPSDLYAVGIMLYEMLTGELPFKADNPMAMLAQHLYTPVPDLSGFAWPPLLRVIVQRLLAKNPDDRYQHAAEVHDLILRVMKPTTGRLAVAVPLTDADPNHEDFNIEIVLPDDSTNPTLIGAETTVDPSLLPPPFAWQHIAAGEIELAAGGYVGHGGLPVASPKYLISRYPITVGQYAVFVSANDGYRDVNWWSYSPDARRWRSSHPSPKPLPQQGDDLPRVLVAWYDAVAYTRWLAQQLSADIALPSEAQWQQAAQGFDGRRFPWGDSEPAADLANFGNRIGRLAPVTAYPDNVSAFGVMGMAGNVREWTLTAWDTGSNDMALRGNKSRVVRGGGYDEPANRLLVTHRVPNLPVFENRSLGFRIVWLLATLDDDLGV